MQLYFVDSSLVDLDNNIITIIGDDYHHIKNVMRMKIQDHIIISDEINLYEVEVINIDQINNQVITKIITKLDNNKELKVNITIAQGLVRREKMEEVIDYITELGAANYLPVIMERSIIKLSKDEYIKKIDRVNKISKEASEQSHRLKKLVVNNLVSFNELLTLSSQYDLCLVAYEKCDISSTLNKVFKDSTIKNCLVLVGPEGGISEKELKELLNNKFIPISLGPRILRTQVAPYYIMSVIANILEGEEDD